MGRSPLFFLQESLYKLGPMCLFYLGFGSALVLFSEQRELRGPQFKLRIGVDWGGLLN